MANNLVMRKNSYLVQKVSEGIPISELADSRFFHAQRGIDVVVIANFTTHGESHFYGLPCPSADSLDPMDHFCIFDVSKCYGEKFIWLGVPQRTA